MLTGCKLIQHFKLLQGSGLFLCKSEPPHTSLTQMPIKGAGIREVTKILQCTKNLQRCRGHKKTLSFNYYLKFAQQKCAHFWTGYNYVTLRQYCDFPDHFGLFMAYFTSISATSQRTYSLLFVTVVQGQHGITLFLCLCTPQWQMFATFHPSQVIAIFTSNYINCENKSHVKNTFVVLFTNKGKCNTLFFAFT